MDLQRLLPAVLLQDGGVAFADGSRITARQREILHCLWLGLENKLIALRLELSESTVEGHLTNIYATLGLTRLQLPVLWDRILAQSGAVER